jgi:hypothetical protein
MMPDFHMANAYTILVSSVSKAQFAHYVVNSNKPELCEALRSVY